MENSTINKNEKLIDVVNKRLQSFKMEMKLLTIADTVIKEESPSEKIEQYKELKKEFKKAITEYLSEC